MNTIELAHPRTPEAKRQCKLGPGACHDCAMTCPHGNTIRDDSGRMHPCGSDVFDNDGSIILCGECQEDQRHHA